MTVLAATSASSSAEPGTLAFLVIFGMAIVLFFLFRSMSKHLRKVKEAALRDEMAAAGPKSAAQDSVVQDSAAQDVASASSPDRSGPS